MIAAVAVISCGLGIAYTFASRSEPDLEVAVVTPEQLPDEVITALQNSLAAYAGDDNGDGHTVVQREQLHRHPGRHPLRPQPADRRPPP